MAEQTKIVAQQISLLRDRQGQNVQTRFEDFCKRAVEALTQVGANGEPIFKHGTAKSAMSLKVEIVRTADDALSFAIGHAMVEAHPQVPGQTKTAMVVKDVGLGQRVTHNQEFLFEAEDGQPGPLTADEANKKLAVDS